MKFSITDFFSKCDQMSSKLRIWSHLLKKSVMENFIFCATYCENISIIVNVISKKSWKEISQHCILFHASTYSYLQIQQNRKYISNFILRLRDQQPIVRHDFCLLNDELGWHISFNTGTCKSYLKEISRTLQKKLCRSG